MRAELLNLITKAIVYCYDLPNNEKDIQKTLYSTDNDKCFLSENMDDIVSVIYNSIIEYSFNEFEISDKHYSSLHTVALLTKLKYKESESEEVKMRYGFFGEVLLHAMLCVYFKSNPLISRGYFYNPLENSETKGYDSYHLIQHDSQVDLWFGEVKFHKNYTSGIESVFDNIEKAISDDYLKNNFLTLYNHKNNFNIKGSKIETILKEFEEKQPINIIEIVKKHSMKLIYPVFIIYNSKSGDYDTEIKKVPKYIADKYPNLKPFNLSINYSIFFVLLPLKDVENIKKEVIKWIESKKPLMS